MEKKIIGIGLILIILFISIGCTGKGSEVGKNQFDCGYIVEENYGLIKDIELSNSIWGTQCIIEFENGLEKVFEGYICDNADNTKYVCQNFNECANDKHIMFCEEEK